MKTRSQQRERDVDDWIRRTRLTVAPPRETFTPDDSAHALQALRERRTAAQGSALLDEVLADLRAGTRRRVPTPGTSPLPF